MGRLDGKVAIVTGGARGMGASHVQVFAAEGAQVVVTDVKDDEGEELARRIGDHALFLHHDVVDEAGWTSVVDRTVDHFGGVDVLVNNAGILKMQTMAAMSLDTFRLMMDVNVTSVWLGMRAAADSMTARGGGSIINISSVEGMVGGKALAAYSASKFAVRGLTRSAARELGPSGIRVNSVHPGAVTTPMIAPDGVAKPPSAFTLSMPIPRWGEPHEISGAVLFLASDEASYCTGSEFVVDGGMLSGNNY